MIYKGRSCRGFYKICRAPNPDIIKQRGLKSYITFSTASLAAGIQLTNKSVFTAFGLLWGEVNHSRGGKGKGSRKLSGNFCPSRQRGVGGCQTRGGPRCPRPGQSCSGYSDDRPPAGPWRGWAQGINPSGMPRAALTCNGLVHVEAVPRSAPQRGWTEGSHQGWVFQGHQRSQDQARRDTALLTLGPASAPSALPLDAPIAPSSRRILLGPFIELFPPPQTHPLPPSPHREPGGPAAPADGSHRAPAPARGTAGLWQRRR